MPRRKVLLTLEYDGSAYHGWQLQPEKKTIEGALRQAVEEALGHSAEIEGTSRTDRGVHASGQAAAFLTESPVPTERLPEVFNARLPGDIRVWRAREVPASFHPRVDALGKLYRFTFVRPERESVFLKRYVCAVRRWPQLEPMREAADHLVGEQDFRCFQAVTRQSPVSTVRHLHAVLVREEASLLHLYVVGNAFLYKMVRTIAGTLLEVGLGKRPPHTLPELIASRDRRRAGPTLEPRGLCLVRVCFSAAELEQVVRHPEADGFPLFAKNSEMR